jgi:ABC-type Fe3+ transport system permease subunit
MRSDRQPRLQPHFDPISVIILVVLLFLVVAAFLFIEHRFIDTQHHTTVIVGKPEPKKQLPER